MDDKKFIKREAMSAARILRDVNRECKKKRIIIPYPKRKVQRIQANLEEINEILQRVNMEMSHDDDLYSYEFRVKFIN